MVDAASIFAPFTALMLVTVASLGGFLPARRAALVEPARALEQD